MVGEVRSLAFVVELIDKATKPLQDILGIGDKLDNAKIALGIELEDGGIAGKIDKVKGGMAKLSSVGDKMGESLSNAGDKMAGAGQKLQQVWDPASQSFIQVAEAATQASAGIEKVTQKMGPLETAATNVSSAIDSVKMKLLAVQVAAGAFMYGVIGAAAEEERLGNITKAVFGEGAEDILKWADGADKIIGATRASRLEMASLFNTAKMGNEQIITTTELVEKYWKNKALRQKLQVAGIGSKEDLAKQIKNVEIGGGRAFGLKQVWGKDALDDVIQNGHGAKKVLSLMQKDLKNTADTTEDTVSAQADLVEVWGEFQDKAGEALLPAFSGVLRMLTGVITLLEDIPGAPAIIAIGAALAFVSVSGIFMVGMLANGVLGMIALSNSTTIAALSSKAFAVGQYLASAATGVLTGAVALLRGALTALKLAMLSNPLTAAFVILLAVLILLETKFHIFSNLFKTLEKVDWAGKWASSVTFLTDLWDGLIERISWVKGLVSGASGALSKLGGGNLAVGGLMVAIPGIGLMVILLKALVGGFKGLLEMTGGGTQFLKDIYNELKKKFDAVLNFLGGIIPGWLKGLFDAVGGFFSWLQEGWTYLIDGLNRILASLNLPQIERPDTAAEKKSAAEKKAALDKELAANATAYNVDQAMGSERGIPAIGAGNLPTYPSGFGGDFNNINFRSKSHPDVTRTGKELTTEQLLTGDWLPENFVDSLKALTEVEKQLVNAKIDAVKNPPKPIEIKVEETKKTETSSKKTAQTPSEPGDAFVAVSPSEAGKGVFTAPESSEASIKSRTLTPVENLKEQSTGSSTKVQTSVSLLPIIIPKTIVQSGGSGDGDSEDQAPASASGTSVEGTTTTVASDTTVSEPAAESAPTGGDQAYDDSTYAGPGAGHEGGRITKTGRGLIHKKEEIISEAQGMMYNTGEIPTILLGIDKIKERLIGGSGAAPSQSSGSGAIAPQGKTEKIVNLNFYAPIFTVASVASGFDVAKMQSDLVKFLRSEIKSAMKG